MRYFLLLLLPALFFSCTSSSDQGSSAADSLDALNTELKVPELTEQEQKRRREQYFIWDVDANQKTISKNPQLQSQFFNVDSLIIGLNEMYPEIRLEKRKIGHDTLYTEISDAAFLTEQMGSAGAEQYIAQAVINLTAVDGIHFVRINFREGSHAAPDVWSRDQFAGYREEEKVELP